MKFADHPSIQQFWSNLSWAYSGGRFDQIKSLDSVLQKVALISDDVADKHYLQLTREQDGATAVLLCRPVSLLGNLERTLKACIGQTILYIGEVEVREDLKLTPCPCCSKDKPSIMRNDLYPTTDTKGSRGNRAYNGLLCDDCLEQSKRVESRANRWLHQQVGDTRPGRPIIP